MKKPAKKPAKPVKAWAIVEEDGGMRPGWTYPTREQARQGVYVRKHYDGKDARIARVEIREVP